MTVIAAAYDSETRRLVVGADRRGTESDDIVVTMAEPKIQQTSALIFGSSGPSRPAEIIDPILREYNRFQHGELLNWLREEGSVKARLALQEAKWFWHPGSQGDASDYDFDYLICNEEGIHTFSATLESHRISEPYHAIGSGRQLALGAMAALWGHSGLETCVNAALDVAAKHDPGVGAPFDVLATEPEG